MEYIWVVPPGECEWTICAQHRCKLSLSLLHGVRIRTMIRFSLIILLDKLDKFDFYFSACVVLTSWIRLHPSLYRLFLKLFQVVLERPKENIWKQLEQAACKPDGLPVTQQHWKRVSLYAVNDDCNSWTNLWVECSQR